MPLAEPPRPPAQVHCASVQPSLVPRSNPTLSLWRPPVTSATHFSTSYCTPCHPPATPLPPYPQMVTIVDPHIKRDPNWRVFKEAEESRLYVQNKEGADFDGWVGAWGFTAAAAVLVCCSVCLRNTLCMMCVRQGESGFPKSAAAPILSKSSLPPSLPPYQANPAPSCPS